MSGQWRVIRKQPSNEIVLARARWCASFWCHFKGLQFAAPLANGEGLIFVHNNESKSRSIHMLFMRFSIGVVWLDRSGKVVDKKLAKPWRPMYAPAAPAQYYIEAMPSILDRVEIGDVLSFEESTTEI